ncbi:ExeM/NucH family extracellular endonuclease [Colwellia echini]|uniref:ExeM/NucH family extracellular endonuclease n=1 Tax=Colwellia echini TaxID=1982103 RepID=A0ABY3MZA2_9GAMM|nr:ExeM/NucH family extracellular endonuclease [Colwellia echini]TYK66558.1 ExeM/NucH family extracellular endonuclease [Colwellia echini]
MRKYSLIALGVCMSFSASAELFISEYVEGGSYNKAIELYNPSNTNVDLSNYKIKLYQNGNSSANYVINLSGSINQYSTFVIAHQDIDSRAIVDLSTTNLLHNGDDAIELIYNDQVIDSFGRVGEDPGSQWGSGAITSKDHSLVRLATISTGDTNSNDEFQPSNEWQAFDKDTLTNLGSHTFTGDDGANNGGEEGEGGEDGESGSGNNNDYTAACNTEFTPIHAIQGTTNTSPIAGDTVWTEGVVTANFQQSGYNGFFMQSADNETDLLAESAEGVFVYHNNTMVNVGDRIRINATVTEYYEQTQLASVEHLTVCESGVSLPTAIEVTLPTTTLNLTDGVDALEPFEGMLVNFKQPLYVTDTYNYGRYGQLGLASERLFNPTQVVTPGAEAQALAAANKQKMIILDDGDTSQNPEILPFPAPELTALSTVRSGDSVENLTAVLTYSFGAYQLLPTSAVQFTATNPRTEAPANNQQSNLRVASFNVLNYFNGDGTGAGFPTERGAYTAEEFSRQREKIIQAISQIDADVIGLMEIENDGFDEQSAITDLVMGLNALYGQNVYQFISPTTPTIGTDAITVGIIYRADKVVPQGAAKVLDSSNSTLDEQGKILFLDSKNRPMLTQQFTLLANEQSLVIAVNHLKSKGSDCNSLNDPDLNDGQGNCNLTRTRAATAMGDFLNTHYSEQASLIIGDLNAYAKEDPITTLTTQGYQNIFAALNKTGAYSYIFNGELGQLDHALANEQLLNQIVDIHSWSINADEPRTLDYSTQYQTVGQQAKFYAPDAYRSSDHDPVIIDIKLQGTVVTPVFGDFDNDQDVDTNDIAVFYRQIASQELSDMNFDFNSDGQISRLDVRGLMQLCSRNRCITE